MHKLLKVAVTSLALLVAPWAPFINPANAATLTAVPMPWRFYKPAPANFIIKAMEPSSQEKKLQALASYDLVLLIDRSASMKMRDCPINKTESSIFSSKLKSNEQSRWQWCDEQTRDLSDQTKTVLNNGIRIVVFSSAQKVYDNVKIDYVPEIFQNNSPKGSTKIALAMESQLNDYFQRKASSLESKNSFKPLLIAIITDGCFEHSVPIQRAITDATKRMDKADEIAIAFLQVGQDLKADNTLKNLDNGYGDISKKASFDIVTYKPFSELKKTGLMDTLLEVVSADISQK